MFRRRVRGGVNAVRARHPPSATRGAGEGARARRNAGSAVVARRRVAVGA